MAGKPRGLVMLGAALLWLGACGGDSSGTGNGGTDTSGDTTADNGGGDTTADTQPDQGGDAGNDTPTADVEEDVPVVTDAWITETCAEWDPDSIDFPQSFSGDRPVRIIIEAVDFRTDTILIRNVSDANFAISVGGVRICAGKYGVGSSGVRNNCTDMGNFSIAAGSRLAIHVQQVDGEQPPNTASERFVWWGNENADLDAAGGEIGIRDTSAVEAESIEAYVSWGEDASGPGTGRDWAASVDAWVGDEAGDFVDTSSDPVGILAVGDVTDPANWVDAGDDCFPDDIMP